MDGGYREFSIASANYVGIVPEGVDPLDAAPLTCAGVTTYKAVKTAKVGPSDVVGIVGIGGLGHLGLQYAKITGGFTVAIDVDDTKLDLAKRIGADHVLNAERQDVVQEMRALGGADAIVSIAATPGPLSAAFASLRPAGRLVLVGLPADNVFPLPIFETVLRGITVVGSLVGTREDLAEVFQLHAQGRTQVELETRDLGQVNEYFRQVLAGSVPQRLVLRHALRREPTATAATRSAPEVVAMKFGVLGTGVVGRSIGGRLAALDHDVTIGTRDLAALLASSEPNHITHETFTDWHARTPA